MNLLNQMRESFPKTIDKVKPVFSSLIANANNDGALQKQLIDLFEYMKEWTSTPNIYEQTDEMLMKTITFFSFLIRFADESEISLKNRFKAIFVRNHDEKWGTPFDIKNVFREYFPHAVIYLIENTNDIYSSEPGLGNLIVDGDIDTSTPEGWTLTNCSATADARFSKSYGIELSQSGASLSQTITIANRQRTNNTEPYTYKNLSYFLHFFLKGKVNVQIYNSANSKYWDNTNKEWKSTAVNNSFSTTDWENCSLYFITEGDDDETDITISFNYVDTDTYIDYFRLFKKQTFGSFTIIVYFEGDSAQDVFGLAAGDSDPNIPDAGATPPQPRYGNYGYYDKSYLSGVPAGFANDIYNDLVDYLRSQGVKAYFDIVLKDINI